MKISLFSSRRLQRVSCGAQICFAYYGVATLSQELENPLGWDLTDLDLEGFQVRFVPIGILQAVLLNSGLSLVEINFGFLHLCSLKKGARGLKRVRIHQR